MRRLWVFFALALAAQVSFWWETRKERPASEILNDPPSREQALVQSFADPQLAYRMLAMMLQNAGDAGGRFTPLLDYDYGVVLNWLTLLDTLDRRADYAAMLAAGYFGQTPRRSDVPRMVEFLRRHAAHDPRNKWRWLVHAIYLARHRAKDLDLALQAARDLARIEAPDMPIWTRQMPAFVMRDLGDRDAARAYMGALLSTADQLPEAEQRFMAEFLRRLDQPTTDSDLMEPPGPGPLPSRP